MGCQKGQTDVMRKRASFQVVYVTPFQHFSTESTIITTEDKNIIVKAYSMQKVGCGRNFESGESSLRPEVRRHGKFNNVNTTERR